MVDARFRGGFPETGRTTGHVEVMGGRREARQGCGRRLLSPGGTQGVGIRSFEVVMVTVFVLLLVIQGALTANVPLPKGECA